MTQQDLFGSPVPDRASAGVRSGEFLKEQGMKRASDHRAFSLEQARAALKQMAIRRADRCVTAEDVAHYQLGNAAGSLFKGGDWEFTGRLVKSARPRNHASDLRVWRLK